MNKHTRALLFVFGTFVFSIAFLLGILFTFTWAEEVQKEELLVSLPYDSVVTFYKPDNVAVMIIQPDGKIWINPDIPQEDVVKRLVNLISEYLMVEIKAIKDENAKLKQDCLQKSK